MTFANGQELLALCHEHKQNISKIMLETETERGKQSKDEILTHMKDTLAIMRNSCMEPLAHETKCIGGMLGGEGRRMMSRISTGQSLLGGLVGKAVAYSMSVMEHNSAMGCVVAAPTAGSSGVIPGVLFAMQEEKHLSDELLLDGFLCAGAIGYLYMRNASVAGAEAGCQAEIGAASAMSAAAIVEMCGGTPEQALDASAISIGNLLGLVCDPVAGLVQWPCQSRNAIGVSNAFTCAEITLSGRTALIPFDEMLDAMYKIGKDMPSSLRETAQGGCASTPTGKQWQKKMSDSRFV